MQETPEPLVGRGEVMDFGPCVYRLRGELEGVEATLSLRYGLNRLGSDTGNDLVLRHPGVSRQHALLLVEPGKVELIDRSSKNGTFVDGRRIRRAGLEPGNQLSFGSVEMSFEVIDPDDVVLALRLTPAPREEQGGGGGSHDTLATTEGIPGRDDPATRWLGLATDFLGMLRGTDASGGQALAQICARLGVEGAVFSSFSGEGVEIFAACGTVEDPVLSQLRQLWLLKAGKDEHRETRQFFLSRPQVTTYIAPGTLEGAFGLTLTGAFRNGDASLELLRMLLTLFVDWHTGNTLPVPIPHGPPCPTLVFPPGYIEGRSRAAQELSEQMEHLALDDLPVLIVGETGVGKELAARILHESSPRRQGPLVAINCAALPAELLEAELFGIGERVATGVAGRRGKFREADGGTLLLDEITEMPVELQAKLLRVLQEGVVEPLGAPRAPIDVRLLAATNTDVQSRVRDGRFRPDLFFRLAGYVLEVPPLRERREDIPLFVEHLVRTSARAMGKPVRGLTVGALRLLMEYDWPGNVRELENQIRRLVCLCPAGGPIDSALVSVESKRPPEAPEPPGAEGGPVSPPALSADGDSGVRSLADLDLQTIEAEVICEALRRTGGNQVQAARLLGISRYTLRRRMQRHRRSIRDHL